MTSLRREPLLFLAAAIIVATLGGLMACSSGKATPTLVTTPTSDGSPSGAVGGRLRVATTTSLNDTGLWDALEPMFENRYGMELDIIAVGTGQALEYGRRGDVDALAIHDKAREEEFVAQGFGLQRHVIAYNYFLVVGPESDPAGIRDMAPEEAFLEVMRRGKGEPGKVWFVSRGDNSGTHAREKLLWQKGGNDYESVRNSGGWYLEGGAGMGAILTLANEKSAYTLTDIGTYLAFKKKLGLVPLVESGDSLLNVYSVIAVNSEKFPDTNSDGADKLIQFLTSEEIQDFIGNFGVSQYGMALFTPARGQEPL